MFHRIRAYFVACLAKQQLKKLLPILQGLREDLQELLNDWSEDPTIRSLNWGRLITLLIMFNKETKTIENLAMQLGSQYHRDLARVCRMTHRALTRHNLPSLGEFLEEVILRGTMDPDLGGLETAFIDQRDREAGPEWIRAIIRGINLIESELSILGKLRRLVRRSLL